MVVVGSGWFWLMVVVVVIMVVGGGGGGAGKHESRAAGAMRLAAGERAAFVLMHDLARVANE